MTSKSIREDGRKRRSSSIRILLLIITAIIVKLAMPVFDVTITWTQAVTVTILAQLFAFMFIGTQALDIALVDDKDEEGGKCDE